MRRRVAVSWLMRAMAAVIIGVSPASAQFVDDFDTVRTASDPEHGWSCVTGDGQATATFEPRAPAHAAIVVDATGDRRGIWWAIIKRAVSAGMDLGLVSAGRRELRVEARIRVSDAPKRVNLSVNTERTTNFHVNLMEFDVPDTKGWHTISFTTHGFDARPGDTVFAQLALMDWGFERYEVDIDYFRVDLVDPAQAGPDQGNPVPYHPPVAAPASFRERVRAAADSTIDTANPDVNLNSWSERAADGRVRLLAVGGTLDAILRFDLRPYVGQTADGAGLLELTTRRVERTAEEIKDFGQLRVREILGGDPAWDERTVTVDALRQGQPVASVFNSQMIIDWPPADRDGGRTYLTIPQPVMQRLIDGRTRGIALTPLGSVMASFYAREHEGGRLAARLLFNVRGR